MQFSDLRIKISEIKRNENYLLSNYYYKDLSENEVTFFSNENGILFFSYDKEYNVYKVYYIVNNLEDLDKLFLQANWNQNSSLEIITKNKVDKNLEKLFLKYGFIKFKALQRMSFLDNNEKKLELFEDINYCNLKDLENLKEIFKSNFNKYSENLPSLQEIKKTIESKFIIKLVDQERMIGFLWFDKKQFLTELRYLFIDKNYRGLNLSKKLIEQYLYLTKDIKKKQLWVLEDNVVAINLYEKFSYKSEGLKDFIFKKEL